jgi:hypothetical protein
VRPNTLDWVANLSCSISRWYSQEARQASRRGACTRRWHSVTLLAPAVPLGLQGPGGRASSYLWALLNTMHSPFVLECALQVR